MLKKLAKYLRALGYDTIFDENLSDQDLQDISVKENRMLLTRDGALENDTPDSHVIYVKPIEPEDQLAFLASKLPLTFEEQVFMTRCLECNSALQTLQRSELTKRVPTRVYRRHDTFYRCPTCKQIFWHGDHVKRLHAKLTRLLEAA
ncbi:MAG: hypothetical protein MAGBODY4_00600 [Candidatus Marinimicrobia bacterium]|nr:hypothetical protein [Candidatus Neomarinimicrobiota bacterium]